MRNRGWILPHFLSHLNSLDYNPKDIILNFIVNDSEDSSEKFLYYFRSTFKNKYKDILISSHNLGLKKDGRKNRRTKGIYKGLAKLRNKSIEFFLRTDAQYYFNIDSDVLVNPKCLNTLISYNEPMVSAIIDNQYGKNKKGNVMKFSRNANKFKHIYLDKIKDKVYCDLSGACILIRREVLSYPKHRYAFHRQGEDSGFHLQTMQSGLKVLGVKGLANHIMNKEMLSQFIKSKKAEYEKINLRSI